MNNPVRWTDPSGLFAVTAGTPGIPWAPRPASTPSTTTPTNVYGPTPIPWSPRPTSTPTTTTPASIPNFVLSATPSISGGILAFLQPNAGIIGPSVIGTFNIGKKTGRCRLDGMDVGINAKSAPGEPIALQRIVNPHKGVLVNVGGNSVPVFRGGNKITVRSIDVKIDSVTGLVKPERGASLNTNASAVTQFGGAYRVYSIPKGLKIIQQGSPTHFEIIPEVLMPLESFQRLLDQVVLIPFP